MGVVAGSLSSLVEESMVTAALSREQSSKGLLQPGSVLLGGSVVQQIVVGKFGVRTRQARSILGRTASQMVTGMAVVMQLGSGEILNVSVLTVRWC